MTSNLPLDFLPRRLQREDASQVLAHFMRLSGPDRSQRFWGALVTDDTIAGYVRGRTALEAAFSIDEPWRGRGLGTLLMRGMIAAAAQAGVHDVACMTWWACASRATYACGASSRAPRWH